MSLFIILFLLVYGSMNAYAVIKLGPAAKFWRKRRFRIGLGVAAGLMALFPIAAYWLFDLEWQAASRFLGLIGYTWMAMVFWTVCFGLLLELWNCVVRVARHVRPCQKMRPLSAIRQGRFLACLILLLLVWGLVEGRSIKVATVHIATDKMPPHTEAIRIVHLSDIHLGLTQGVGTAGKIISMVRELDPDIIVDTGDLLDVSVPECEDYLEAWRMVKPPLGKFGVLGNHEFYAGEKESLAILNCWGFTVLREKSVLAGGWLRIAGVDDPAGNRLGKGGSMLDEEKALQDINHAEEFVILLKHRPRIKPESAARIDLQLSGHTHGGQLFPFHFFTRAFYPLGHGLKDNGHGGHVYVSRGAGNWGPPMRFLAPREITLIVLTSNDFAD